ncbi:hypothetical protein HBB16_02135 [Pseudonocardia sp. MCCB 268]|nr:hypothetical protein [Pseudonocardia cytotoxica]
MPANNDRPGIMLAARPGTSAPLRVLAGWEIACSPPTTRPTTRRLTWPRSSATCPNARVAKAEQRAAYPLMPGSLSGWCAGRRHRRRRPRRRLRGPRLLTA